MAEAQQVAQVEDVDIIEPIPQNRIGGIFVGQAIFGYSFAVDDIQAYKPGRIIHDRTVAILGTDQQFYYFRIQGIGTFHFCFTFVWFLLLSFSFLSIVKIVRKNVQGVPTSFGWKTFIENLKTVGN